MTTHFKNGVTNVVGKDGGSSVFSGIKQPLITGGYEQEQAYQNDWQIFNCISHKIILLFILSFFTLFWSCLRLFTRVNNSY